MRESVTDPARPEPAATPLIRALTIVAGGLSVASITVNLILQVARFLKKRPMEPDQRDRVQTATLAVSVLRQLPVLIRQIRLLADQVRAKA